MSSVIKTFSPADFSRPNSPAHQCALNGVFGSAKGLAYLPTLLALLPTNPFAETDGGSSSSPRCPAPTEGAALAYVRNSGTPKLVADLSRLLPAPLRLLLLSWTAWPVAASPALSAAPAVVVGRFDRAAVKVAAAGTSAVIQQSVARRSVTPNCA